MGLHTSKCLVFWYSRLRSETRSVSSKKKTYKIVILDAICSHNRIDIGSTQIAWYLLQPREHTPQNLNWDRSWPSPWTLPCFWHYLKANSPPWVHYFNPISLCKILFLQTYFNPPPRWSSPFSPSSVPLSYTPKAKLIFPPVPFPASMPQYMRRPAVQPITTLVSARTRRPSSQLPQTVLFLSVVPVLRWVCFPCWTCAS